MTTQAAGFSQKLVFIPYPLFPALTQKNERENTLVFPPLSFSNLDCSRALLLASSRSFNLRSTADAILS